ncbi:hypothetical protein MUK42_34170 [Musa troglodytarum]|uniref:Uncharacterized protein n=1 Tax=Musa troglodytarum TaxID=320322 RepID=A0A9E7FE08_9LILI|nr:hypothetical protein MUK42_34170 [Musa troglodytarum]
MHRKLASRGLNSSKLTTKIWTKRRPIFLSFHLLLLENTGQGCALDPHLVKSNNDKGELKTKEQAPAQEVKRFKSIELKISMSGVIPLAQGTI